MSNFDYTGLFQSMRTAFETYWADCEVFDLDYFRQGGVGGAGWIRGTRWKPGLTDAEIDAIAAEFDLVVAPSYHAYLSVLNAPDRGMTRYGYVDRTIEALGERAAFHDWADQTCTYRWRMESVLEGILFDVERNGFWPNAWGGRPKTPEDRADIVRRRIAEAPALIPIFSHRFLLPLEVPGGGPVLSIHQSEAILYETDLARYLADEFQRELGHPDEAGLPARLDPEAVLDSARRVPFWGELID